MSKTKHWVLGIAVFIAYIGISVPYPIFPVLFLSIDSPFLPESSIMSIRTILLGTVLAIYPLGQLIGNMLFGFLSDHYDRKLLLCTTLLLTSIGYFFSAYSIMVHSTKLLIVSRFLTGLFEGNIAIVQSIMVNTDSKVTTAKNFSWIFMWCTFGFIVGPFLGGVFSASTIIPLFSYSTPFYVVGFFTASIVPFVFYFVKKPLKYTKLSDQNFSLKDRLTLRYLFLKIMSISLICFFAIDLFFSFAPIYFFQKWGLSILSLSFFSVCLSLWLALAQGLILPFFSDKLRISSQITSSLIILPIALTGIILINKYYLIIIIIPFIATAIASFTTNINVMVTQCVSQDHLGKIIGLMRSVRAFGDTLACLFAGTMAGIMPILPLLLVISLFLMAFLFYFLIVSPHYNLIEKYEEIK